MKRWKYQKGVSYDEDTQARIQVGISVANLGTSVITLFVTGHFDEDPIR